MKKIFFAAMAVVFMATLAMADELRVIGYYDTIRDQETITLNGWANLPHNFGFWGFVDFTSNRGDQTGVTNQADLSGFYTEFNLHYKFMLDDNAKKQLRLMAEINDGSLSDAVFRPGLQYFQATNWGNFSFKVLPYKVDLVKQDPVPDPTGQVSLAWRINLLKNKVYFEGFADLNWLYQNQRNYYPFIVEPQLGYNLTKHSAVVVEYRYNNFQQKDDHGLGIGAEWRF
jgi:opacity protein-like surface antigen